MHLHPLCSSYGFCTSWHPSMLPPGTDEAGAISARLDTTDVAVVMVGPSTPFALQEDLQSRQIPVVPVVVREVDLSIGPLAGRVRLPRDKAGVERTLTSVRNVDSVLVEVVGEIRGIAERLKAHAASRNQPAGYPSWVDIIDWTNDDIQEFSAALADAYDDSSSIRSALRHAGVSTGSVYLEGAPRYVWHDSLQAAYNQGKLRALFDHVRRDPSKAALFARWA